MKKSGLKPTFRTLKREKSVDFPGFSLGVPECIFVDIQQFQDGLMRVIEFIAVVLYGSVILSDDIRGKAIKGFEDLRCGGMGSITIFGVEF